MADEPKKYDCPYHPGSIYYGVNRKDAERLCLPFGCPKCVDEWSKPLGPLTREERVERLRACKITVASMPFELFIARVGELVGRSLWTHEIANIDALIEEVECGTPATFADVIAKAQEIAPGRVAVVVVDDDGVIGLVESPKRG